MPKSKAMASRRPIKPLAAAPTAVYAPKKLEPEAVDLSPEEWAKKLAEFEAIT